MELVWLGQHCCRKGPSQGGRSAPESEQTESSPRGMVEAPAVPTIEKLSRYGVYLLL